MPANPDFNPQTSSNLAQHSPSIGINALPPPNRLTLLRRRLTSGALSSLDLNSPPSEPVASSHPVVASNTVSKLGTSDVKGKFRRWMHRRRGSGSAGVLLAQEGMREQAEREAMDGSQASIIDIPGGVGNSPSDSRTDIHLSSDRPHLIDPFAHPSPAFAPYPTTYHPPFEWQRPQSPHSTATHHSTSYHPDYSMTSPHARRTVAAATRSITLAQRTDMPPFTVEQASYEVDPDASLQSFAPSSLGSSRHFIGARNTRVPQNTPTRIGHPNVSAPFSLNGTTRFSNIDQYFSPSAQRYGEIAGLEDSFVHISRTGLMDRDLNRLPIPTVNANPRWQRLKYILQFTAPDTPPHAHHQHDRRATSGRTPSPHRHARNESPLTPPHSPTSFTTDSSLSSSVGPASPTPAAPDSYYHQASPFRPDPHANPTSTPHAHSNSPQYHLSLPDFSTFDWSEEPSQLTREDVSLADTDQGREEMEVCSALDALWMYDSDEDEPERVVLVSAEHKDINTSPRSAHARKGPVDNATLPKSGLELGGVSLATASSSSASNHARTEVSDNSGSSAGYSLVVKFPIPPERHRQTATTALGSEAVPDQKGTSRNILESGVETKRQLLPSKYRPGLTSTPLEGGTAFPFPPFTEYMKASPGRRLS